ncbi:MAG: hypothetical protein ACFCUG_09545 [Thiotrichales bacterium]
MNQPPTPPQRPVETPGLERTIWRKLPHAGIASTLIPIVFYLYVLNFPPVPDGGSVEKTVMYAGIAAISIAVTLWTAILTVGIGCWIVMVMKGPAKHADSYHLIDAERPQEDMQDTRPVKPPEKKYRLKV